MTKSLSWLHFSDLHWGMGGFRDRIDNVHEALVEDIEKLRGKCGGGWDVVFFTGDLAAKGEANEYGEIGEWLARLRKAIGGHPVFLCVPGNHDLVRPPADDPGLRLLTYNQETALQQVLAKNDKSVEHAVVHGAFANYSSFRHQIFQTWNSTNSLVNNLETGLLPGDFCATLQKQDQRIGVIGLNSGFLQLQSGDYQSKLHVHPKQFTELLGSNHNAWFKKHPISLLLTHHGPEWLEKNAQRDFFGEMNRPGRFALHLCGHQHETLMEEWTGGGSSRTRRLFMVNSLFGLEKYEVLQEGKRQKTEDRRHGYCAGLIDFSGAEPTMRLFPRLGVRRGDGIMGFGPDIHQYIEEDGGTKIFTFPGKVQVSREEVKMEESTASSHPTTDKIRTKVEQNIRRLLLRNKRLEPLIHNILEEKGYELVDGKEKYDKVTKCLLKDGWPSNIIVLKRAMAELISDLRAKTIPAEPVWLDCKNILGWLLLQFVNEHWNGVFQSHGKLDVEIKIPLETPLGGEIFVAQLDETLAKITLSNGDLSGEGSVCCDRFLARGWGIKDPVEHIKENLWMSLSINKEPWPSGMDSETRDRRLNAMLHFSEKEKNRKYLVVETGSKHVTSTVLDRLKTDLSNLKQVVLARSGDENLLLVSEDDLWAGVTAFFKVWHGEMMDFQDEKKHDRNLNIFISYAHEDEPFKNELEKILKIIKRKHHKIDIWTDRDMFAGDQVEQTILSKLERADIVCMLISRDFIASDFCYSKEMSGALRKYNEGRGCPVSIIIRETADWHEHGIGKHLALPTDGKPMNQWIDEDAFWADVQRGMTRLISEKLAG